MVPKTASLPDMFFSPVLVFVFLFFAFVCTCWFFGNALVHWYLRGILRVGTFMRTQALIVLALCFPHVLGIFFLHFCRKKLQNRVQESTRPTTDAEDLFFQIWCDFSLLWRVPGGSPGKLFSWKRGGGHWCIRLFCEILLSLGVLGPFFANVDGFLLKFRHILCIFA